jgi:hypothetical protein
MTLEPFGSILGALGSIASFISAFALWKQRTSWVLPAALLLIFALTALSSYFSYQYFQLTQPVVVRRAKQDALRSSIQAFLAKYPTAPSYWEPGQNEGIIKSGLIILELHKDLFPDSYAKIRSDVDADISFAQQHRDGQDQRAAMYTAAKNVLTVLKALAGGT